MSRFTYNGRPIGYFTAVMDRHSADCLKAIADGVITPDQADQVAAEAITGEPLAPGGTTGYSADHASHTASEGAPTDPGT